MTEQFAAMEFTCPSCGGHTFGTTTTDASSIGTCYGSRVSMVLPDNAQRDPGEGYRPCDFTWNRDDDARYFAPRAQ